MTSSQTTSFTKKKKESIIDGCLFVQAVVMERVQTENEDVAAMEHVVSRVKQTGLFNLGRQHSELYDESLVEEFHREDSICFHSVKKGGDVADISATIHGVEMEELESFGSEDLMSTFWCVFIGDNVDKNVHLSCHKNRFIPPFIYLHDLCCRVVENHTGAFEMCTNLRFWMMLQEEVSKPLSHKKSFGLLLNNIFSCLDVPFSKTPKKIGPGKFIGGCKPTAYNKDIIPADRPSVFELPQSVNIRDVTEKSKAFSSKKRKNSVLDKKLLPAVPEKKKKKLKKPHKPKPTEASAALVKVRAKKMMNWRNPLLKTYRGQPLQKK
ncbi:hypothetical protein OROMI_002533 [Orobanche minor]